MTSFTESDRYENNNAFARERDRMIIWLLERHPATAGMLAGISLFTSRRKAHKRLNQLLKKNKIRRIGTVSLSDGRPEHVYSRGRFKGDNLIHEVQITQVCLKVHANEVRRGLGEVDTYLRPDAELWINGERFCLELDCGTMSYPEIVRKRFAKYTTCKDFVLWVCPTASRMDGLRQNAAMLRETALFTTLDQALTNPHEAIWIDVAGQKAALPRGRKVG